MEVVWPKIVGLLLLPPGIIVCIALLGFLLSIKWPKVGFLFFATSMVLLFILSLPLTGVQLLASLEDYAPPLGWNTGDSSAPKPGAIVILGGGIDINSPEYEGDTVNSVTFERLRYGATVHRKTGLPILVSGGAPDSTSPPEAEVMEKALLDFFQIKARWKEPQSRTTLENMIFSRKLLSADGINTIYLVTHSWHMRRAAWTFEQAGITVIPAPHNFTRLSGTNRVFGYFPSSNGLSMSSLALHEYLGLIWYKLRYRPNPVVQEASVNSP